MFTTQTIRRTVSIATLILTTGLGMTGCGGGGSGNPMAPQTAQEPAPVQPPVQQRSGIRGTARVAPGVNADLRALRVTAHKSEQELYDYIKSGLARVRGTGPEVSWDMSIPSGVYFILAWLDLDNNGYLTYGDIIGIHGRFGLQTFDLTEVQVWDGEVTDIGTIECEVLYGKPSWMKSEDWDR